MYNGIRVTVSVVLYSTVCTAASTPILFLCQMQDVIIGGQKHGDYINSPHLAVVRSCFDV
jgi:hypothetical protein